ncbi:MAG: hypothetical protein ABI895_15935 [Deltaproteobacteria bacterium]
MTKTRARSPRIHRTLWLLAALTGACHSKAPPPASDVPAEPAAPDRLRDDERLPEAETAFGLSLPPGMRLTRQFNDSAYFLGKPELSSVILALQPQLTARSVEMSSGRALFAHTQLKRDSAGRWLRIEVSAEGRGTQVYVQDVTPPPAVRGLSEQEIWSRVGRNPDGTPIDENQQY